MFSATVKPRFYETDAFRHVNNIVVAGWFETAREPIFNIFNDGGEAYELPLILAKIEINYVAQIYYGHEVTLKTAIEHVGNSSFIVRHEAWQQGKLVATGTAVQVHFDHNTQKSQPLSDSLRAELTAHLASDPETPIQ